MNKKIIIEDGLSLYYKTGIGQYTINLYNALTEMGYNVEMKRKPFLEKIKNSTVKRILYILWLNLIFPIYLLSKKNNIVIFPATIMPLYKLPQKNFFPVIHDVWVFIHPEIMTIAQYLYAKFTLYSVRKNYNKIITVSKTSMDSICKYLKIPKNKINIVYNTSSFETLSACNYNNPNIIEKLKLQNKKYILSVATSLSKKKNLQALINAYAQIQTDYILVLVGKGNSKDFNTQDKEIIFTGFISDEDLEILYKNASIYAFPSIYEGFGIPLIDAQKNGVPVICSNIPIFKEIGANSVLFAEPTTEGFELGLKKLMESEELRHKLINLGFKNYERFTLHNIQIQLKNILENN